MCGSNNITTMLKGIAATDETSMLCSTSLLNCLLWLSWFPIDYDYKLGENGESLKMYWFGEKFRFLMKWWPIFLFYQ